MWSRETEIELEEEVWSRGLPDDVFCTVLAFLPLSSFIRMRCVCKKWSLMAQDQNYIDAFSRVPPQEPSLFLTRREREGLYWAYEPALNAWTCLPSSFFKPNVTEGACYQVTTAGGRLLFMRSSPHYSLMVYNPFNKTQRTLPPMFDMSGSLGLPSASEIHVMGMYVDTVEKYYNILVVDRRFTKLCDDDPIDSEDDDELEPINSQIYDSRTCAWEMIEEFNPYYELRMLNAALFANTLHCLTVSPQLSSTQLDCSVVDELAVYTVFPEGWEHGTLRVPTQDQALVAPHIFSTRGRPMLAAAVPQRGPCNQTFPVWKGIIIWELEMVDAVEDKWVKLTEIDLQEVESFTVSKESFMFLSEWDSLYFGSNTGSSLGVINIHTRSWRLLPPFPGYVLQGGAHVDAKKFQAFVYEPRFDLVA